MAGMAAFGLQAQYVDITNALYPERYEQNDTTHHPGDDIIIKSPTVLKYVEQRDSLAEAAEQTVKVEVPATSVAKAKAGVPASGATVAKGAKPRKQNPQVRLLYMQYQNPTKAVSRPAITPPIWPRPVRAMPRHNM